MNFIQSTTQKITAVNNLSKSAYFYRTCFGGLIMVLGFAPFHYPGMVILGLSILFAELQNQSLKKSALIGCIFGASFMGFGVSWIFLSINQYGNLNIFLSLCITILFVFYLSMFFVVQAWVFNFLSAKASKMFSAIIFSATWCISEFLRANFASGFPWLLIGFGQTDSPLKYLLPYIGVYGVGFITSFCACCLCLYIQKQNNYSKLPICKYFKKNQRINYLIVFLIIILSPIMLKNHTVDKSIPPIKVGIVQANLSMRDKWDDAIFKNIIKRYADGINNLKNKAKLIVLPESAIPVTEIYAADFIRTLQKTNKIYKTQVLVGIPKEVKYNQYSYYNALTSFGTGKSSYLKQHLVPFGEYIPKPFNKIADYLDIPDAQMLKGPSRQNLLQHNNLPFATLICFEVAYPDILRRQLPDAKWIVSVSDAGWFGHSLAIYQLLQMSQTLSIMSERYQIVANNNGLSAIIDNQGDIINSLPAFKSADLQGIIYPISSKTLWSVYGDNPYLFLCIVIIIIALFKKKSYSYKSILK